MSEPNDRTTQSDQIDPELLRERQRTQLEVWQAGQRADVEIRQQRAEAELRAAVESGLYTRLAWARAVAQSDLVPAGFRAKRKPTGEPHPGEIDKAAASIVLAQEWGEAIGLGGMKALMHLQVIEGNIGVKPASARGMMANRGIEVTDEWAYSAHGVPIRCVTSARRENRDNWNTAEYTIDDAVKARLCRVERDDAGEVTGVFARSSQGNPKPWETVTKDMLMWRATSRLVKAHYTDIVGGMDFTTDLETEAEDAAPPVPAALVETMQRVASQRADRTSGDGYNPAADLEVFSADDPWWDHAGRTDVKRRTKKQMAADRLAEALAGGDTRVPAPPAAGQDPPLATPDPREFVEEFTRENDDLMRRLDDNQQAESPTLDADDPWAGIEPPADWQPSSTPAQQETRAQLLTRLDDTIEAIGRPRDDVLARHRILLGGRDVEDWTDDEIRRVLTALNQ